MPTAIRIIAQKIDTETEVILDSTICKEDTIKKPGTLEGLGYMHVEQIDLLKSLQDFKIKHQCVLINQSDVCPNCEGNAISQGTRKSPFHAVLTDHEVLIRRRRCSCGWSSPYSLEGIYGSSIHPDLLEKQVVQGTENSYRSASKNLNGESHSVRPINNIERIRNNVAKVGNLIAFDKLKKVDEVKKKDAASNLIAVVDGGHIKSNEDEARSFEAMIATVYNPKNIRSIDKNHNEIYKKTSVASALSDKQETIKQLIVNACRTEGSHSNLTTLTCLTDGANNCWSITNTLEPYVKTFISILDWFHITKRFTVINNCIHCHLKERLDKVKWHLWHGKSETALNRINTLINDIDDEKTREKLTELYSYINRNKQYLVNYQLRQSEGLPFTSTLAESSVNSLINRRQKNNKKMQWSRYGSHHLLQIETSIFSKTWDRDWDSAKHKIYKLAA